MNIELHPVLQQKLAAVAQATGVTEKEAIGRAVEQLVQNWEDVRDGEAALKEGGKRWTLDDILEGRDLAE